jgi:hypothetical protein
VKKKLLIGFVIGFLIGAVVLGRIYEQRPGTFIIELVRCQVEIYNPPAQPVTTVVFACPRVDAIRFWPIPVVQPWYEDWWEKTSFDKDV